MEKECTKLLDESIFSEKKSSGVDEDTVVVEEESARLVESKSDEVQSINLLGNKGP